MLHIIINAPKKIGRRVKKWVRLLPQRWKRCQMWLHIWAYNANLDNTFRKNSLVFFAEKWLWPIHIIINAPRKNDGLLTKTQTFQGYFELNDRLQSCNGESARIFDYPSSDPDSQSNSGRIGAVQRWLRTCALSSLDVSCLMHRYWVQYSPWHFPQSSALFSCAIMKLELPLKGERELQSVEKGSFHDDSFT